ncbi:MAG: phosphatase [Cytophagales bacterium]|nr:phosphatase [Cytophagales bacterium]
MKLAAIDIGSNAARMQISAVLHDGGPPVFKKVEYIRFPLQLGKDVFHTGRIGPVREANLVDFLHACQLLMKLHGVARCQVCATSAMREAENGPEIVRRVQEKLGLRIQVIGGAQEAELVNRAVVRNLPGGTCLHVDVGGGSTELNVYQDRHKTAARSFRIGSVRLLEEPKKTEKEWRKMAEWLAEAVPVTTAATAVGTGGNIGKLVDLAATHGMAQATSGNTISRDDLAATLAFVERHSVEERINRLLLNPDRADVIVPAGRIYLFVMEQVRAATMQAPDVGLIDGLILKLYERPHPRPLSHGRGEK